MTMLATTDIQSLVDRLFDDLPTFPELSIQRFNGIPAMDVYEKDGKYIVELAVPGYQAKEIHAEVNAGQLTITGSHSENTEKKTAKFYRKEMYRGSFTRTIALPQDIDSDKVEAKVEKGVLELTLVPLKPIAAKKISIKETSTS